MALSFLGINCTLKSGQGEETSSTDVMMQLIMKAFADREVRGDIIRAVDFDIKPGVTSKEGLDDEWPGLREQVLKADILILGTPIWLGQPSSVCKRVLERLNAFLSESDDEGRMISYDRVAGVAVVGNEDGAHHVSAELYQGLNDVGFTLPANAVAYWVGEAMGSTDFKQLEKTPDKVTETITALVRNSVHLANLLQAEPYPSAD